MVAFGKDCVCGKDAQDGCDVLEEVGAEDDHDGLDDISLTEPPNDIDP